MNDVLSRRERVGRALLLACGVWLVGLGIYFILVRPPLLPEDPRYIGLAMEDIQRSVPGLAAGLGKVFTVMGGFMATGGVLTLAMASQLARLRGPRVLLALAVAGATGVGLMSAVNFVLHSDFRWLLLVPPLLWLGAVLALLRRGPEQAG